MSWATRFLFDDPAPLNVDGTGLQADSETLARVRGRQLAAREAMGTKWLGHLRHTGYTTKAQLVADWNEALMESAERSQLSVLHFPRRKA